MTEEEKKTERLQDLDDDAVVNKNEDKIQNMKKAFEAITVATRAYDKTLRECVIQPNSRIDTLYKKIESTMARW